MLKRLLFGNEAKLHFKTSTSDGIARLFSEAGIAPDEHAYWQKFVCLFDTASDVFTLLSVADVRRALIRHPENIATLVRVLVNHLQALQDDPLFSPPPNATPNASSSSARSDASPLSPTLSAASSSAFSLVSDGARRAAALGMLLGGSGGTSGQAASASSSPSQDAAQRDRHKEALNCCRILTRILPIIMEGDHDSTCNVQADGGFDQRAALESDSFEQNLLWSTEQANAQHIKSLFDDPSSTPTRSGTSLAGHASGVGESTEDQFVIEEDDSDAEDTNDRTPLADPLTRQAYLQADGRQANAEAEDEGAPLGDRLTRMAIDLLFYSGFTIPWTDDKLHQADQSTDSIAEQRIHHVIWAKGVGSSLDLEGQTRSHESRRLEVLRLLLTLLGKNIYVTPALQQSTDNQALRVLATSLERSIVLPLLCSLLNVSVVWLAKKENWLGALTSLPAGLVKDRLVGSAEDTRQATVTIALQLLNIVLSYEPLVPSAEALYSSANTSGLLTPSINTYSVPGTPQISRPALTKAISSLSLSSVRSNSKKDGQQNSFRHYFCKLHRRVDFDVLAEGIFAVLAQRSSATALLNPTAASQVTDTSAAGPHVAEVVLILWRLLWHNRKFRAFLLENYSPQLLSHLLFHALNNKDSAARQGLVRLIVFILHDISCDRAFAINICKAGSGAKARISGSQRWGVAAGGGPGSTALNGASAASGQSAQASTGADILVQSIYALIATTKSFLSALYSPMVITLTNISPYFKGLSILSSNRLLALFTSFSNPAFLLADEGNPRVLYFLIETLNNVVQHGFQRNPNVAYAIVRNHHSIERLANFTLRRGIAEIRRSRRRSGLLGSVVSSPRSETPTATQQVDGIHSALDTSEGEKSEMDGPGAMPTDASAFSADAQATGQTSTLPPSEKARGKMRRSSTSSDVNAPLSMNTAFAGLITEDEEDVLVNGFNEEELYLAASTIGRGGFVPSQSWVTSWHKGLPLDVLQITVVELVPKVQELCARIGTKSDADERVLAWLREQNLESVLPPLVPTRQNSNPDAATTPQARAFKWTPQVTIWLLSYIWGLVYVTSTLPYGLFNGTCARLFQLRTHDPKRTLPSGPAGANARSSAETRNGEEETIGTTSFPPQQGARRTSMASFGAATESEGLAMTGMGDALSGLGLDSHRPGTQQQGSGHPDQSRRSGHQKEGTV